MTPDDVARVAEIRARADAATDGPWTEMCMGSEGYHVYEQTASTGTKRRKLVARCTYEDWETDKANAPFIAAARADVPWLLDRLAAETAEVERLREAHADCDVTMTEAGFRNITVPKLRASNAELRARLAAETERADQLDATVDRALGEVEAHIEALLDMTARRAELRARIEADPLRAHVIVFCLAMDALHEVKGEPTPPWVESLRSAALSPAEETDMDGDDRA